MRPRLPPLKSVQAFAAAARAARATGVATSSRPSSPGFARKPDRRR